MPHYDVIIAGGGPAGSTIATLVKKYAPASRVLVLEKAQFPRHHIGESLLAGATPILQEMGAYEQVNQYGFVEKLGATYIWGQNRAPWGFEFDQIVSHLAAQGRTLPDIYTKAWQVRRHEYDTLLLNHAAEMGAEVKTGARVHTPIIDEATRRVTGVEYSDEAGRHTASSSFLIDCTGQDALLGRLFNLREYDTAMNNYALYGYWKNAKWKMEYVGHPNLSRIFIATTPHGWIWYIPLSTNVVSVGFVTHRQLLQQMPKGGAEQLYQEELRACPEINGLLAGAELIRIADDQPRDVMSIQDWSYCNRQFAGLGWATCGDAAGFVDPVLSSGMMLAHELGQKAAYTLNSVFRASSDEQIDGYWNFYEDTYRTYLKAYRDMAAFWYSNNFSMESWWWQAQRILQTNESGTKLKDPEAFNRIATGYANRAESLSLFGSYPLHEAISLVDGIFGRTNDHAETEARYAGRKLALHPSAQLSSGMYYFQGQIRNTRRVSVPGDGRYLDLHPGEEMLLRLFDGKHTLDEINRAADEIRAMQARMPVRRGTELVVQLDEIGALG